MSRKILIVAEHDEGNLKNVTKEILSLCSKKGNENGFETQTLVYGSGLSKKLYDEISTYGVQEITYIDDDRLRYHNPQMIIPTLIKVIANVKPELVLFGNTAAAKDIVPWLAQYFSSQMISDAIDVDLDNENIVFKRPLYGGRIIEKIEVIDRELLFASIRPNVLGIAECERVSPFARGMELEENQDVNYHVRDVVVKDEVTLPITEAEVIVAGGRAFKSGDDFTILHDLAKVIGATVGASRPIIDLGIKRRSLQIGQSGKSVSPRLIFTCGISGQIQFVAGMRNSKTVIAINRDREATIFKTSDYGVVGDVYKIVPLITEKLKKSIS